ncbi:hypothetical protein [Streptomyces sp. NPDC006463]|uniref:hypothetical protein n=1 Tax=Streptomyces sp. NPDC006463 TaxID=3364746 RepID=UPI0036B0B33B
MKRRVTVILAAVSAALTATATSAPASAADGRQDSTAIAADSVASDAECWRYEDSWSSNTLAVGCFSKSTDDIYVQDSTWNSVNTYVAWTNEIRSSDGSWGYFRSGTCVNAHNAPNWGVCYKDFYEHSTVNAHKGRGSRIMLSVCEDNILTPGSDCTYTGWIYNDR